MASPVLSFYSSTPRPCHCGWWILEGMGPRSIKINTTSWFIKSFLNALRKCQKSDPLTEKSQRIVAAYGITRPFQNHHKSPQKTNGAPCDKISFDSFASTRHIWDKWIHLRLYPIASLQSSKLSNCKIHWYQSPSK